jgi:polar amino acid transport system substrate-binding protein
MGEIKVGEQTVQKKSALTTTAIILLVLGIIVGLAIGWVAKPSPPQVSPSELCAIPKSKFTNPPPPNQTVTIIYGFDANYPPFTYVLPNGTAAGFDVDVMKWIANKYNWTLVFKPWDWSTIVTALVNGDLDVIMSGMTITAQRSQQVWFSIPYYSYIHELVTRSDVNMTMEQILNSGKPIAVELGATSDEWATRLLQEGYNFQKLGLDSYTAATEAVLKGTAIAMITDSAFFEPYVRTHPDAASKLRVVSTLGAYESYAVATRPGDLWLRNQINSALSELMGSPMWDQLLEKWNLK